MINDNFKVELETLVARDSIIYDAPIKDYSFIKLGGLADCLVMPNTYEEVQDLIELFNKYDISFLVVGNFSNLIISDKGFAGVIISLKELNETKLIDTELIKVQAGRHFISTSHFALENSLSGLEFACGIPGTVGGAVFMNAGAYGYEVKDILDKVTLINLDGEIYEKDASELDLGYRYSNLSMTKEIILDASFKLKKGNNEEIKSLMDDLTSRRKASQPLEYPSCGSVFKRPNGDYAGRLIQHCGLQGYRIGGAEVSRKHSGFIVNIDNATATDYISLIEYVKSKVYRDTSVLLELEVKIN